MKIELTPQLEAFVRKRMATGNYASELAVIEALADDQMHEGTGYTNGEIRELLKPAIEDIKAGRLYSSEQVWAEVQEILDHDQD